MNKNVGILTFHYARNYGAVLQAYAMQHKLQELKYNVEIIDYRNSYIMSGIQLWNWKKKGIKGFLYAIVTFIFRAMKKYTFYTFIKKRIVLSPKITKNNLKLFAEKYNVLITGSDQVWNTKLTDNDMVYFLDFARGDILKIAYAVSFGDREIILSEKYIGMLKKLDYITLRENAMQSILEEVIMKTVKICCDPTLLLTSDDWKNVVSKRNRKKPYLFLFMIEESPELLEYAKKVAEQKSLTLVSNKYCFEFFMHSSPEDFLSWILHANYVLTNSFHGTIFSIIFQKQFLSHVKSNDGTEKTRIIQLLEKCGLEHRTLTDIDCDLDTQETWDIVEKRIKTFRDISWNWVEEILCGGKENAE